MEHIKVGVCVYVLRLKQQKRSTDKIVVCVFAPKMGKLLKQPKRQVYEKQQQLLQNRSGNNHDHSNSLEKSVLSCIRT